MCQEPIKLIKCLYNKSNHSNILRFSDKCLYAYKDLYQEEPKINYNEKSFSLDPKIINLIEELGIEKSGGFATHLAFRLVPEELKEYIVVGFVVGTKKVYIDYDTSYYLNNFKSIEPRTNKIYTNVWRTKPRVVGQPFVSAILPKSPPNTFWVNI